MDRTIGVTRVYGRGRTQIPREIREKMQINANNDNLVWKEHMGTYYIIKES